MYCIPSIGRLCTVLHDHEGLKTKVNIWAGLSNHRLAVIKLPDETSELRGFRRLSLPANSVCKVGQPR